MMAVSFTRKQIEEMEAQRVAQAPRYPTSMDAHTAPAPVSFTSAGGDAGMLINFRASTGQEQIIFLNPVLAKQLFINISLAADVGKWWDDNLELIPSDA